MVDPDPIIRCEGGCGADVTEQARGMNATIYLYCPACRPAFEAKYKPLAILSRFELQAMLDGVATRLEAKIDLALTTMFRVDATVKGVIAAAVETRKMVEAAARQGRELAEENQEKIMSAITDYTDKVTASLAAIATGIAALDADIQALQAQVAASGTLSATDAAALQSVVDKSAALAATAGQVPAPPAPPPAPAPAAG